MSYDANLSFSNMEHPLQENRKWMDGSIDALPDPLLDFVQQLLRLDRLLEDLVHR